MTTAAHHAGHGACTAGWVGWVLLVSALVLVLGAVVLGVVRVTRSGRRVPPARVVALVAGCLVVAAALAPPLADRAHHDLRAHMVQHMLLGSFGPLLLALGGPVRLVLGAGGRRLRGVVGAVVGSRWLRVVGHPVTAGVLAAGGLYALYGTELYTLSTRSTAVHVAVHVHLLAAGYLLAWSLVGVDPAPHRPGLAVRVAVLVATGGTHAHLAKHLYAHAGELPPGAGQPAAVVREAAQWMYYTGDVAEVAIAAALFAGWYRSRWTSPDRAGQHTAAPPAPTNVPRHGWRRAARVVRGRLTSTGGGVVRRHAARAPAARRPVRPAPSPQA